MTDRGEMDDDLDEPMASQSVDSEAPLTHNSSKSNFFASPDEPPTTQVMNSARGSFKNSVSNYFSMIIYRLMLIRCVMNFREIIGNLHNGK